MIQELSRNFWQNLGDSFVTLAPRFSQRQRTIARKGCWDRSLKANKCDVHKRYIATHDDILSNCAWEFMRFTLQLNERRKK